MKLRQIERRRNVSEVILYVPVKKCNLENFHNIVDMKI